MSDDDLKKAKRMAGRLYALGERKGSSISGELAQLLVSNAFSQTDKFSHIVEMCLETSDVKISSVPLNKAVMLFMAARDELVRPFTSRSDCLQSCIFDILLCYISFWGQIFEYYESMYYKPVSLPNGEVDTSPAIVSFEAGWAITCLFIRDTMLSSAARSAGLPGGYNRTLSWYYYPANSINEMDEAKGLVLTVIGQIRKRGTILVSSEGMIGHISFSNSMNLKHWVEDKLDKDWNNKERLEALGIEYFERTSLRVNVRVIPKKAQRRSSMDISNRRESVDSLNGSFSRDIDNNSLLDIFDEEETTESATNNPSVDIIDISSRSISLSIRPITPILLGSPLCEWSGIDMLEFCKTVAETCVWPAVVNTVLSEGEIGISMVSMESEVVLLPSRLRTSTCIENKRYSVSAPSSLIDVGSNVVMSSPSLPRLVKLTSPGIVAASSPLVSGGSPGFGFVSIPALTPTPVKEGLKDMSLAVAVTPVCPQSHRDSDVSFSGPLMKEAADIRELFDTTDGQSVPPVRPVSSRPSDRRRSSVGSAKSTRSSMSLEQVSALLSSLSSQREVSPKDWSVEKVIGPGLMKPAVKSIVQLYKALCSNGDSGCVVSNNPSPNKRKRRSFEGNTTTVVSPPDLTDLPPLVFKETDGLLKKFGDIAFRNCLSQLNKQQQETVVGLTRILAISGIFCANDYVPVDKLKGMFATAADFVSFSTNTGPSIPQSDVHATGLRALYAEANISMFEVAKDIGLLDWASLCMYYNDEAYVVLMGGPTGLLVPAATAVGSNSKLPTKLVKLSLYEQLAHHCLLVCSELMMRWSWCPSSKTVWGTYDKLVTLFQNKRHGRHGGSVDTVMNLGYESLTPPPLVEEEEISVLNSFVKQCLVNAGTYLADLGDRIGSSRLIINAAFDILRSVFLLRPTMFRSRHVYQIVHAALVGASVVFARDAVSAEEVHQSTMARIYQAAIVMHASKFSKVISEKFILNSISLSGCDAAVLFSDCSGALMLPNANGLCPPELFQVGTMQDFYERVFYPEMQQVLFNLAKMMQPTEQRDYGPFVQEYNKHESLSPCAFASISHVTAVAAQQVLGQPDMQFRVIKYASMQKALALATPLGVLPCLAPPVEPYGKKIIQSQEWVYKWLPDAAVKCTKNGAYSVIPQ